MKQTFWQRLDLVARQMTPLLATLLFVMLGLVPTRLPHFAPVMPWIALIAVFYWTVYRAELMPPLAVFGVGVFHDLAAGTHIGVSAVLLLLTQVAVMPQRRFFVSRSFMLTWLGFSVIAAGAIMLMWGLNALLEASILSLRPAVFQFLTTVAAYPPLAWLFGRMQRWLLC